MCGLVLSVYDDLRGLLLFTFNSLPSLRLRFTNFAVRNSSLHMHYAYATLQVLMASWFQQSTWPHYGTLEGGYENEAEEDQP